MNLREDWDERPFVIESDYTLIGQEICERKEWEKPRFNSKWRCVPKSVKFTKQAFTSLMEQHSICGLPHPFEAATRSTVGWSAKVPPSLRH